MLEQHPPLNPRVKLTKSNLPPPLITKFLPNSKANVKRQNNKSVEQKAPISEALIKPINVERHLTCSIQWTSATVPQYWNSNERRKIEYTGRSKLFFTIKCSPLYNMIYSASDASFHPDVGLDAGAAVLKLETAEPRHFRRCSSPLAKWHHGTTLLSDFRRTGDSHFVRLIHSLRSN